MSILIELTMLEWWIYLLVIMSFFSVALVLNYIVKKINEARLEERFIRLQNKASNNRSIQVQQLENHIASRSPLNVIIEQSNATISTTGTTTDYNKYNSCKENDQSKSQIETNNLLDTEKVGSTLENINNLKVEPDLQETGSKDSLSRVTSGEIVKPGFLGTIYRELSNISIALEKSKSLSNTDKDAILEKIVDKMVLKIKEAKSTPTFENSFLTQNDNLRTWSLNLIEKRIADNNLAST